MRNLENTEILSDEIIKAIDLIISMIPDAVFGGSIALNAVGLLGRKISDIDVFFHLGTSLSKNGFVTLPFTEFKSDTVTNTNGKDIQRTALLVCGVKVCAFKVEPEEMQYSKTTFERDGVVRTICIQNVNYAIMAKLSYASKTTKHKEDLKNIDNVLSDNF